MATGLAAVLLLIAPVTVGAAALADGGPVIGGTIIGFAVIVLAGLIVTSSRRYGRRGDRWVEQLRTAAAQAGPQRQVEVWFVVPILEEGKRSQRTVLVCEPGGRPVAVAKLLVELGRGLDPGPGRAWGGERGEPLLLEKDGRSLWPARPTKGRAEVALVRFAAAFPFSTRTLRRPGTRSR